MNRNFKVSKIYMANTQNRAKIAENYADLTKKRGFTLRPAVINLRSQQTKPKMAD